VQGNVCLLLAMLKVDRPDVGRIVSMLHLITGDEVSTIRKLTMVAAL
jgi:hypothetical protein